MRAASELVGLKVFGIDAGWSSLAARRAHNPKVVGSNPAPATNLKYEVEVGICKSKFESRRVVSSSVIALLRMITH